MINVPSSTSSGSVPYPPPALFDRNKFCVEFDQLSDLSQVEEVAKKHGLTREILAALPINSLSPNQKFAFQYMIAHWLLKHSYSLTDLEPIVDKFFEEEEKKALLKDSLLLKDISLQQVCTLRNFAHLLADVSIEGQKDATGTKLSGNIYAESIAFFIHLLEGIPDSHNEIKELIQLLRNSYDICRLEYLPACFTQASAQSVKKVSDLYVNHLMTELNRLSSGEKFLIPTGWNSPTGGHAMMLEMEKNANHTWNIKVYNTGEGLQYHPKVEGETTDLYRYLEYRNVPHDQVLSSEWIRALQEPRWIGMKRETVVGNKQKDLYEEIGPEDLYRALFNQFESYKVAVPPDMANMTRMISAQRGGTCSFRVLLAALRGRLGEDGYKQLKQKLQNIGIELGVQDLQQKEAAHHPDSERLYRLLKDALHNLSRATGKLVDRPERTSYTLTQADKELIFLQQKLKELETLKIAEVVERDEFTLNLDMPFPSGSPQLGQTIQGLQQPEAAQSAMTVYEPPVVLPVPIYSFTNPATVVNELQSLEVYCKAQKDIILRRSLLGEVMRSLPLPPKSTLWQSPSLTVEQRKQCVALLRRLHSMITCLTHDETPHYGGDDADSFCNPSFFLAFYRNIACCYHLIGLNEQAAGVSDTDPMKMSSYQIDIEILKKLKSNSEVHFNDKQLEDNLSELIAFFDRHNDFNRGKPVLFDFEDWNPNTLNKDKMMRKDEPGAVPLPESGDYHYLLECVKKNPTLFQEHQEEIKRIQNNAQAVGRELSSEFVSVGLLWGAQEGSKEKACVPQEYCLLRSLAFSAHSLFHGHLRPGTEDPQIQ